MDYVAILISFREAEAIHHSFTAGSLSSLEKYYSIQLTTLPAVLP